MRTRFFQALAAAAFGVALAAPAQAESLKIGALMPMTGDLQAYGEADVTGVQFAVKQINAAGGVNGEEVEIVIADTQTKPQAGVDAAQKLINVDGVHAIVGALSSGVTIPVAKTVTSREGVPQISNASTSPTITKLQDNDFLFRSVPSDAYQGVELAKLVQEKGFSNVSILYVNNDYGQGLADAFAEAFEGEVSASIAFEQGQASYRGELQQAAGGGAEALVLIGYPESGSVILRQSLEGGYLDKFIFTDGMKAPEIIERVGAQFLNGAFGTVPQAKDTEGLRVFREAYTAEYGDLPPKPYYDTAYDAAMVIALAAQKAGSSDPEAIRDNLRDVANAPGETILPGEWQKAVKLLADGQDINYEGASGSVDFDKNGDVPGTIGHWEIQDGKIVDVRVLN
ncbi:ABC transporter substrate-binding protein [Dichotomicrobium thermohalophilum]|uniref:Amino acid/amide ABC transporter substrate-binding protein (HAAT family) n=1 Tax=Dichotomicrobium thermohalophilum TaxID=933063 RepID=A0A397Q285_9HYPH|nr:ABC transporter substrate-binding protein [Dichotomicrobium thermohalophilum]RIA55262.1 amino acid/amide ABC transporter substrate-binding protein (HAAT family) [Dichotomicrobium thermohalophilum]